MFNSFGLKSASVAIASRLHLRTSYCRITKLHVLEGISGHRTSFGPPPLSTDGSNQVAQAVHLQTEDVQQLFQSLILSWYFFHNI